MQPGILLPILTSGTDTGVVIDMGQFECRAIAIAFGRPILPSYVTIPVGVSAALRCFCARLPTCTGQPTQNMNVANNLFFVVATGEPDPDDIPVSQPCVGINDAAFVLPGAMRRACLQVLIDGTLEAEDETNDDEFGGVSGLLAECLRRCNHDVRAVVVESVLFTGGGAMIPGTVGVTAVEQ